MYAVLVQPSSDTALWMMRWNHSKRERSTILPLSFCDTGVEISISFTTCKFLLGSAPASLAMKEYEKWRWETKRTLKHFTLSIPKLSTQQCCKCSFATSPRDHPESKCWRTYSPFPAGLYLEIRGAETRNRVSSPLAAICFERQSTLEPGQSSLQAKPGVLSLKEMLIDGYIKSFLLQELSLILDRTKPRVWDHSKQNNFAYRELINVNDFSHSCRARHNDYTKQLGIFPHLTS